jgi:hypothetical protein
MDSDDDCPPPLEDMSEKIESCKLTKNKYGSSKEEEVTE